MRSPQLETCADFASSNIVILSRYTVASYPWVSASLSFISILFLDLSISFAITASSTEDNFIFIIGCVFGAIAFIVFLTTSIGIEIKNRDIIYEVIIWNEKLLNLEFKLNYTIVYHEGCVYGLLERKVQ